MKLAEALSLRKDLEKRISGLKERLENVHEFRKMMPPQNVPQIF